MEQIAAARAVQFTREAPIGAVLVSQGAITEAQLEDALKAQNGLRSTKRHLRAIAQATIAQTSSETVAEYARDVKEKVNEVKRKTTNEGYPAVTPEMLRKQGG